jgi:hypothetical protein
MKLLSALLPNTAISWGFRLIVAQESKRKWFFFYVLDMQYLIVFSEAYVMNLAVIVISKMFQHMLDLFIGGHKI